MLRFSRDLQIIDNLIPLQLVEGAQHATQLAMNLVLVCVYVPWYLLVLVPLLFVFYKFRKLSIPGSRDLKRIEGITRSPIYNIFSEVISGLETIRAYRMKRYFIHKLEKQIELNGRAFGELMRMSRWFGMVLETFVFFQTMAICILCVVLKDSISPAMASLCITYATLFGGQFQWMTRLSVEVETLLTAVERLHYFTTIDQEKARYTKDPETLAILKNEPLDPKQTSKTSETNTDAGIGINAIATSWPSRGEIEMRKLQLRYRNDLPLILKDISCTITGGEKIGICGRTGTQHLLFHFLLCCLFYIIVCNCVFSCVMCVAGAGKSSIMVALYRLFEPEASSEILIDGVNIMHLGLFDLRSNLAIIPQAPVLFSGTLRFNLDPFSKYTDAAVWDALKRVKLFDYIDNIQASKAKKHSILKIEGTDDIDEKVQTSPSPDGTESTKSDENVGLQYKVAENGSNFSQGQKQLICIARALLRKPKILLLDEATSSVDTEMDAFIQQSIKNNFSKCTVLTIAHRLDTIIDSDRIMVLDAGKVVEFDAPQKLLDMEEGVFAKLWKSKESYE